MACLRLLNRRGKNPGYIWCRLLFNLIGLTSYSVMTFKIGYGLMKAVSNLSSGMLITAISIAKNAYPIKSYRKDTCPVVLDNFPV